MAIRSYIVGNRICCVFLFFSPVARASRTAMGAVKANFMVSYPLPTSRTQLGTSGSSVGYSNYGLSLPDILKDQPGSHMEGAGQQDLSRFLRLAQRGSRVVAHPVSYLRVN